MILKEFKDSIGVFEYVLSKQECEEYINLHKASVDRVYEGNTSGGVQKQYKNTTDLVLSNTESELLADVANECIDRYVRQYGRHELYDPTQLFGDGTNYPHWQVQRYKKNEGHYVGAHTEENHIQNTSNRLFVTMFYLNNVDRGGVTTFPLSNIKIKPTQGTFMCWPAGWPWVHAGQMPKSNDKYIATSWLRANWETL
jgi:hypothetical protein